MLPSSGLVEGEDDLVRMTVKKRKQSFLSPLGGDNAQKRVTLDERLHKQRD